MACLQIYRELLSLAIFLRVHSNSKSKFIQNLISVVAPLMFVLEIFHRTVYSHKGIIKKHIMRQFKYNYITGTNLIEVHERKNLRIAE